MLFWINKFLNGMMKFQLEFCHPSELRLWRIGMLILTKSNGHKSNVPCQWIHRQLFYRWKFNFSFSSISFFSRLSLFNTLSSFCYFHFSLYFFFLHLIVFYFFFFYFFFFLCSLFLFSSLRLAFFLHRILLRLFSFVTSQK